jgi:hypothetical protein
MLRLAAPAAGVGQPGRRRAVVLLAQRKWGEGWAPKRAARPPPASTPAAPHPSAQAAQPQPQPSPTPPPPPPAILATPVGAWPVLKAQQLSEELAGALREAGLSAGCVYSSLLLQELLEVRWAAGSPLPALAWPA